MLQKSGRWITKKQIFKKVALLVTKTIIIYRLIVSVYPYLFCAKKQNGTTRKENRYLPRQFFRHAGQERNYFFAGEWQFKEVLKKCAIQTKK